MSQPRSLSARDLQQRLQAGEPLVLVDVREQGELELAALPGVVHLPLGDSQQWLGQLDQLLARDKELVVLCHGGIRSWQFGCWLMETQGYSQVWNLEGGIDAWSVQVDPKVPRY